VDVLQRSSWLWDVTGFDVITELEGVLLGWVGGKGAQLIEEMMEDEIGQHHTDLLRKFTQNKDIPLPCHVIR
jgi:demethoxyubiquinone hydroxylase (CLK1/Coq7/Cat5 family)